MKEIEEGRYMQTVALKEVKCFAYHGYYPEEQILGCFFILDLEVEFIQKKFDDELSSTINYEELNTIILSEMKQTQKLLETVISRILESLIEKFPFICSASVSIRKLNPPMLGQVGCSFVKLDYTAEK